LRLVEEGS